MLLEFMDSQRGKNALGILRMFGITETALRANTAARWADPLLAGRGKVVPAYGELWRSLHPAYDVPEDILHLAGDAPENMSQLSRERLAQLAAEHPSIRLPGRQSRRYGPEQSNAVVNFAFIYGENVARMLITREAAASIAPFALVRPDEFTAENFARLLDCRLLTECTCDSFDDDDEGGECDYCARGSDWCFVHEHWV